MTPLELVADLKAKYPARAKQLDAWLPQYQQLLGNTPGDVLGEAYMVLMTGWKDQSKPPNPATVAGSLPIKPRASTAAEASDARERKRLVDDANAWWAKHFHRADLFREYQHRSNLGPPSPEQLEAIAVQVDIDKRIPATEKKAGGGAVEASSGTEVAEKVPDAPAHPLNPIPDPIEGETNPPDGDEWPEIPFD